MSATIVLSFFTIPKKTAEKPSVKAVAHRIPLSHHPVFGHYWCRLSGLFSRRLAPLTFAVGKPQLMKVPTRTSFALSAILASLPVSLAATPELTCMKPAWDRELEVQIALQDGIAGVVIEAQPDLKEIAELSAASAKHDLTMTDALRTWIWETDPARLNTPEAYRAFSWTDEDRAAWVTANASAAALQALHDDLNAQLAAHPDVNAYFCPSQRGGAAGADA